VRSAEARRCSALRVIARRKAVTHLCSRWFVRLPSEQETTIAIRYSNRVVLIRICIST